MRSDLRRNEASEVDVEPEELVLADELIEDREIAKHDQDRLGHREVADQLGALIRSVDTPANIALFGAWGSGKSGIGNLLGTDFEKDDSVSFVRFDAFKYAENPLRRQFISAVARELNVPGDRYRRGMYSGSTSTTYEVSWRTIGVLAGLFLGSIVAVAILVLGLASLYYWASGDGIVEPLTNLLKTAVPSTLVPAALITAVASAIMKPFVVVRQNEPTVAPDEFEALFSDVIKKSGASKVVIFVDELDRCAPKEVVATLDAVRTFFGVPRCVFVIAADPQVLEEALTRSLRQATPTDTANPYYSVGSAYLDKVFQYQVTVPPLLTQSVTSFGVSLVDGKKGVWAQVDTEAIVSILIPTHVRSPRRVKHLLNTFVMTYRLALSRQAAQYLDINVNQHVEEIARLVCLTVEFPLFARDLVADPNLSKYVLGLAEAKGNPDSVWSEYPHVRPEVKAIADGYAALQRPVDVVMADEDEPSPEDNATPDSAGEPDEPEASVAVAHGRQLIDYLRRTRLVEGPTQALLHLQTPSAIFGLEPTVAEGLRIAAENADVIKVAGVIGGLSEEHQQASIRLLDQQLRVAIGIEALNVMETLLGAIAIAPNALGTHASTICGSVAEVLTRRDKSLSGLAVEGAWHLARAADRTESLLLGRAALASEDSLTDRDIQSMLIADARDAARWDRTRFSHLVTTWVLDEERAEFMSTLAGAPADSVSTAFEASREQLVQSLRSAVDEHAKWRKKSKDTAVTARQPAAARQSAAATDEAASLEEPMSAVPALKSLRDLALALSESPVAAGSVMRILLEIDRSQSRDAAQDALGVLPSDNEDLATLVLKQTHIRLIRLWPKWLTGLSSTTVQGSADAREALLALVSELRRVALKSDSPAPLTDVRAAATSIAALLDSADEETRAKVEEVAGTSGPTIQTLDEGEIEARRYRLEVALALANEGLASPRVVATGSLALDAETLALESEIVPANSDVADHFIDSVRTSLEALTQPSREPIQASIAPLIAALDKDNWLDEFTEYRLRALLGAYLGRGGQGDSFEIPPAKYVTAEYAEGDLGTVRHLELTSDWLRCTEESVSAVLSVVKPLLQSTPTASTLTALRVWAESLGPAERHEMMAALIGVPSEALPEKGVLEAIGIRTAPGKDVVEILVERYRGETANPGRARVLSLAAVADLNAPALRARVIREILIPMLELNSGSAESAITHIGTLAKPVPKAVKGDLLDAAMAATANDKRLRKRALSELQEAGYTATRKGLMGKWKIDL